MAGCGASSSQDVAAANAATAAKAATANVEALKTKAAFEADEAATAHIYGAQAIAEAAASAADAAAEAADAALAAKAAASAASAEKSSIRSASSGGSNAPGSHQYCAQLADIGRNVFATKQEGHGMQSVLAIVANGLSHDAQRRTAAGGVVIAIYGDDSISSGTEAYDIVYSACTR